MKIVNLKKSIAIVLALMTTFSGLIAMAGLSFATSFDIPVSVYVAQKTDTTGATVLEGIDKPFQNVYFMDIRNQYGAADITRLASLGFINTYGSNNFRPTEATTGYELLEGLVRVKGNGQTVMDRAYAKSGTSTTASELKRYAELEFLQEAKTLGIINENEIVGLSSPISREKAALFITRAAGTTAPTKTYQFTDYANVSPVYRQPVENVLANGLLILQNDGSFKPKSNLARSEMAMALASILKPTNTTTAREGLIFSISESKDKQTREISVKTTDGTVYTLKSTEGSSDYVTYKGGIVSGARNLELGDQIRFEEMNGNVRYVEVIQTASTPERPDDVNAIVHFGKIVDTRKQTEQKNGKPIITEIYRVIDVSGATFDIQVVEDGYTGKRDDIVTYKSGKVGGVALLSKGDVIEYVTIGNEVSYILAGKIEKKTLVGTVREITPITSTTPAYISVFGYDDAVHRYPLAPYANISINSRGTTIDNLRYGMPVKVEISGGLVVAIKGESYSGEPGYIPSFGKMRMGVIENVFTTSFRVKLDNEAKVIYSTNFSTQFIKNGARVDFSALKAGERVKLYFSTITGDTPDRIEIEGSELLFDIIYKGKINNVNPREQELELTGVDGVSRPELFENSDWRASNNYSEPLYINSQTEIYTGSMKLTPEMLERYYTGYPVYAVVKTSFGTQEAVKVAIRTGGESLHSSQVRKLDLTNGEFELTTRENFRITDSTMVIKDGLLVPFSNIRTWDSVDVVAESVRGSFVKNALVVRVTSKMDNIFDSIRIGAIESVNPSGVTLANHTSFSNNMINSVNPNVSGQYKFYTNTVIKDVTVTDKVKTIKPSDMWHDKYGRSENKNVNTGPTAGLPYIRYYAFMVVNPIDGSVTAMNIRHNGLLPGIPIDTVLTKESDIATSLTKQFENAVLTRGLVTSKDTTWDRVELTDAHDYTKLTQRWSSVKANIFVKYKDAIIIKNSQVIGIDDVKLGDYLYIMRIGSEGLVIFVK